MAFIPLIGIGADDISAEYLEKSWEVLEELKNKDERIMDVDLIRMYPGLSNLLKALELKKDGKYQSYRCKNISNHSFTFLPNGEIHICGGIPDKKGLIGRYKPFFEVDYNKLKEFEIRRIDKNIKCQKCLYKVFCQGECPATSLFNNDDIVETRCKILDNLGYLSLYD